VNRRRISADAGIEAVAQQPDPISEPADLTIARFDHPPRTSASVRCAPASSSREIDPGTRAFAGSDTPTSSMADASRPACAGLASKSKLTASNPI
jgi:hypothetical protein